HRDIAASGDVGLLLKVRRDLRKVQCHRFEPWSVWEVILILFLLLGHGSASLQDHTFALVVGRVASHPGIRSALLFIFLVKYSYLFQLIIRLPTDPETPAGFLSKPLRFLLRGFVLLRLV